MTELVLHPRTKQVLDDFATHPSHAVLLVGPAGGGKTKLAEMVAAKILNTKVEKLTNYAYFLRIQPVKKSISIDEIRQAQDFVKLKTTGQQAIRRVILVEDAHTLTVEAQNAFLKLLEEPPADTLIIMTINDKQVLLPTILSRAPQIVIQPPTKAQLLEFFGTQGYKSVDIERTYYMSDGQPGLMTGILAGENDNQAVEYIAKAKELLTQPVFQRLTTADQLIKQKTDLNLLLWAMERVSSAALQQAARKNAEPQVKQWQAMLSKIVHAQDNIKANPQGKLLLTDLLLPV